MGLVGESIPRHTIIIAAVLKIALVTEIIVIAARMQVRAIIVVVEVIGMIICTG